MEDELLDELLKELLDELDDELFLDDELEDELLDELEFGGHGNSIANSRLPKPSHLTTNVIPLAVLLKDSPMTMNT